MASSRVRRDNSLILDLDEDDEDAIGELDDELSITADDDTTNEQPLPEINLTEAVMAVVDELTSNGISGALTLEDLVARSNVKGADDLFLADGKLLFGFVLCF